MPFHIIRNDITKLRVDAIVNAANPSLLGGGGVDGAIHRAAGPELRLYCANLGGCRVGEAKLSPGFHLPAKWVIHTVGPVWQGGGREEEALLSACYRNSLKLALEQKLESVAFPLISAGAYGYPKDQALDVAVREIGSFLLEHDLDVTLVIYDERSFQLSSARFSEIQSYLDRVIPDDFRTPQSNRMEREWALQSMEEQATSAQLSAALTDWASSEQSKSGIAARMDAALPAPAEAARPSLAPCAAAEEKPPKESRLKGLRRTKKKKAEEQSTFFAASPAPVMSPMPGAARPGAKEPRPASPRKPKPAKEASGGQAAWFCFTCGEKNTGRYCSRCGTPEPQEKSSLSAADLNERLRMLDESFSQMLLRKIDEKGISDADCYKRANVDRRLFSKIRSDPNYRPAKPTVLAFAIALELALPETNELLRKAGFALSHSNKFDVIIEYFILHSNYNIFEINEALFAFDQSLLGA